ncbi:hypothetical protein SAMN05421799_105130 [Alicyclobacillus vulcanalis]|uniref:Uncharacterized protein n=1 Tax=Alicyclobacillus vulcanalis TaxID=252246 RepID=A0A1N7MGD2_9BACL|nr:DUF6114 domain-containing protein [Alicyclobacillus vulcanalis]SIS85165.1 hypothetical protein SAMN05421799_105130 [Alicyclobacillus vulcanalis]
MATAKIQDGGEARDPRDAQDASGREPQPHVFQYAIIPTRWPTADPSLLSEWRENVFLQLGSTTTGGPSEVRAPEGTREVAAERGSALAGAEPAGQEDDALTSRVDSRDRQDGEVDVASQGQERLAEDAQDADETASRRRRRRHEALDLNEVMALAQVAAPEASNPSGEHGGLDEEGSPSESASQVEVPPGALTPSQIVRGDPLRLPDEEEGRRRVKPRVHNRGEGVMAVDPETVSVTQASQPGKRPAGVVVDVEATEAVPPAPASKGFRRWRRTRPFWAGLLSMLGGAAVAAGPASLLHVVAFTETSVPLGAAVGVLIFIMGLLEWFFPFYSVLTGAITVVLALISLISSSFGGLFIGMMLSLIGGAMAVAWRPATAKASKKSKKAKAPNLPNTPSASA